MNKQNIDSIKAIIGKPIGKVENVMVLHNYITTVVCYKNGFNLIIDDTIQTI